jgi:hypothetical protein
MFALPILAIAIFLIECAVFHVPLSTGLDVLVLAGLMIPGVFFVIELRRRFKLRLTSHEVISLGFAVGFGIVAISLEVLHWFNLPNYSIGVILLAILAVSSRYPFGINRKPYNTLRWRGALKDVWLFLIFTFLLFAAYNLQQFHFTSEGGIVTHGLFGIDIPFLAGQVHGIRDFGSLRDLHQNAQPWHYHDATYQLLALLPRNQTIADLAFAAPLVGYTLLAFSVFTLVVRFTSRRVIGFASVGAWFLVSGISGTELSSYALSPSFVFGSVIALNVLLLLDVRVKGHEGRKGLVGTGLILFLFAVLSQTKISTFLALAAGLGLLAVTLLRRDKRLSFELLGIVVISFSIVVLQSMAGNPLMPGGDFLIGAPLLGYANHLAAALYMPVASLNPISHGLHLRPQSVLLIPYSIFHLLRFALFDPKILAAFILLLTMRGKWQPTGISKEVRFLLLALLLIGLLLPVLYSPAWYPLALSFYAPLVSSQMALLFAAIGFSATLRNKQTWRTRIARWIVALLFVIGFIQTAKQVVGEDEQRPKRVSASLISAMSFLSHLDTNSSVIATRRFDLDSARDESYYWYSALSGHPVLSEGAKYGSLLAAVADTNSEKGLHPVTRAQLLLAKRRALIDTIFLSRDSGHVRQAINIAHVGYIVEDGPIKQTVACEASTIGSKVFENSEIAIWKVR